MPGLVRVVLLHALQFSQKVCAAYGVRDLRIFPVGRPAVMHGDPLEERKDVCLVHTFFTPLIAQGKVCIHLVGEYMDPFGLFIYPGSGFITVSYVRGTDK